MRQLGVCLSLLPVLFVVACASSSESPAVTDAGKEDAGADAGQGTKGGTDAASDVVSKPNPMPTTCVSSCGNQQCGLDSCGRPCGSCPATKICVNGLCEQT